MLHACIDDTSICLFQDCLLRCLKVNGTRVEISQTLEVEEAIRTIVFSPDYDSLLLVSNSVSLRPVGCLEEPPLYHNDYHKDKYKLIYSYKYTQLVFV